MMMLDVGGSSLTAQVASLDWLPTWHSVCMHEITTMNFHIDNAVMMPILALLYGLKTLHQNETIKLDFFRMHSIFHFLAHT